MPSAPSVSLVPSSPLFPFSAEDEDEGEPEGLPLGLWLGSAVGPTLAYACSAGTTVARSFTAPVLLR